MSDVVEERNHWIKLFNRLDAAVARWAREKTDPPDITDAIDSNLIAAHERVLKSAADRKAGT